MMFKILPVPPELKKFSKDIAAADVLLSRAYNEKNKAKAEEYRDKAEEIYNRIEAQL